MTTFTSLAAPGILVVDDRVGNCVTLVGLFIHHDLDAQWPTSGTEATDV